MQNFVVQKKNLSIHSEDRDITKWPSSSQFAVDLPVEYKNVVSLRLSDIELPSNFYVFSEKNQNTKGTAMYQGVTATFTITEGTYTSEQLSYELSGQLNAAFSITDDVTKIQVFFNSVSMKFIFISNEPLSLDFTKPEFPLPSFYSQYSQWGLGSYLGFAKQASASEKLYTSTFYPTYPLYMIDLVLVEKYVIEAPFPASLFGDNYIYMELELYNSMDEIAPYTERSSSMFNAKYNGKHNSAFAKIPMLAILQQKMYVSKESFLFNIFFSDPPLERIQKLQFKFRYHDGRPVHFGTTNFSFTIEITMLKPDSIKPAIHVQPNHYRLN
jgi:hypothetical protein